jgi:UDP-N-acetylglucosamine 2-epimerase (non-hydrolysing)
VSEGSLELRDSIERRLAITEAQASWAEVRPDRDYRAAAREVLSSPPPALHRPALWDGRTGQRIAAALVGGHHASPFLTMLL